MQLISWITDTADILHGRNHVLFEDINWNLAGQIGENLSQFNQRPGKVSRQTLPRYKTGVLAIYQNVWSTAADKLCQCA